MWQIDYFFVFSNFVCTRPQNASMTALSKAITDRPERVEKSPPSRILTDPRDVY